MPTNLSIKPFANETESVELGDLTIENRLDQVTIYGSLSLMKDKNGLAQARELKNLLDSVMKALELLEANKQLPDNVLPKPAEMVKNPFG